MPIPSAGRGTNGPNGISPPLLLDPNPRPPPLRLPAPHPRPPPRNGLDGRLYAGGAHATTQIDSRMLSMRKNRIIIAKR
jgi:hypothetical protein